MTIYGHFFYIIYMFLFGCNIVVLITCFFICISAGVLSRGCGSSLPRKMYKLYREFPKGDAFQHFPAEILYQRVK